ncbi:MAG: EVE domain-containing protein [Candidatus Diapherotrites archaeon]|nr:EVE domain-containing protein [Candidatus Diapherotrites archaeon]
MKKAFVWDPVMRSSAIKYDPCILLNGKICKTKCDNCKITLIADRFLGKEFQQEILGKIGGSKGRYPYVIIADSLGCNLHCWFCYAYKFLTKESAEANKCDIAYVSPKELAEQFGCKIRKLADFQELLRVVESKNLNEQVKKAAIKHLQMKLPLMRIRLSGGEPTFSTKDTLFEPQDENLIKSTVMYWLSFFKELDKIIGLLKKDGKLNIANKMDVKNKEWKGDLPFPTCLGEREGRLNIRYDTNGIIFGNKEITKMFIGGLFKLFKQNKLNHIFIEFDYSFKGATPVEYEWSQRRGLPVDASKISFDYKLKEHPQIPGYLNIIKTITEHCKKDVEFNNCAGITVERGINHNKSFKTYLNCKESLNWENFSKKSRIRFSVVDNPIEMFNWRNYTPKSCFIKNGASIKVISGEAEFDLKNCPDMNKFSEFVQNHPNCYFVIYPVETKVNLQKITKIGKIKLDSSQTTLIDMQFSGWVFSGTKENWKIALEKRKWGVKEKNRSLWQKIKPGDIVLFYVTTPISRIMGFGKVKETSEENSLLWPDEIKENNLKYPLRIIFEEMKCIEDWENGVKPFGLEIKHGINQVNNYKTFEKIVNTFRNE